MGFYVKFRCTNRVIGSVSSGMMSGACWCGHLVVHPGLKDMLPFRSTLGGGTGANSGVASGVSNLRDGVG